MTFTYRADAETPSFAVEWKDADGDLVDFSSGFTFSVELVKAGTTVASVTKTNGIAGASVSPNVTVAWAAGELAALDGVYELHLKATDSSSNDRFFSPHRWPTIRVTPVPSS